MKPANKSARREIPASYDELLKLYMLRPIHDKVGLANALEVVDLLAGHDLNPEQEDYLEVLSRLVEAYENEHHPEPKTSGLAALRHLMRENGLTAADLSRILKARNRSTGSKILNGERRLTARHLRLLGDHFKVEPGLFLRA